MSLNLFIKKQKSHFWVITVEFNIVLCSWAFIGLHTIVQLFTSWGKAATIFIQQFSHFWFITVEIQYHAHYCLNYVHPPSSSVYMDSPLIRKPAQGVIYGKEEVPTEGPACL